jgi:hypothetical protein
LSIRLRHDMTDIEELIIDWYKLRRRYIESGFKDEFLPEVHAVETKLEMFAISVLAPVEYKKLKTSIPKIN